MEKGREDSAVILEETYHKQKKPSVTSTSQECLNVKSQAACRGYLVRALFSHESTLFISQNPSESAYVNILSLEAQKIYRILFRTRQLSSDREVLKFEDGAVYVGGLSDSKLPSGEGENFSPNGGYMCGMWVNGECSGLGTIIYANGDYYQGDMLKGKSHGIGVLKTICSQS